MIATKELKPSGDDGRSIWINPRYIVAVRPFPYKPPGEPERIGSLVTLATLGDVRVILSPEAIVTACG